MGSRRPADHPDRPHPEQLPQKMLRLVPLLAIASASPAASPASSLAACKACSPPTFPPTPQGRPLWLPHCVNGKSLNFCDAVCSGEELSSSNQGSCEGLNTVIPGKTKLPLSHQLPAHLQDFGSNEGK